MDPQTIETAQANGPHLAELASRVEALSRHVKKLQADQGKGSKRFESMLGICGGVLGILSTIIAFPKAIAEMQDAWFAKPNITSTVTDMAVHYEPAPATYTLEFPAVFRNDGNKSDTLQSIEGNLRYSPTFSDDNIENDYTESYGAAPGEFTFYKNGTYNQLSPNDQFVLPLPIDKQTNAESVFISVVFDKGTFDKAGSNRLDVLLISGSGRKAQLAFCFDISDPILQDLNNSTTGARRRFIETTCGGGE